VVGVCTDLWRDEAIAPYMDRINVISRFGSAVKVRDCHIDASNPGPAVQLFADPSDINIGMNAE